MKTQAKLKEEIRQLKSRISMYNKLMIDGTTEIDFGELMIGKYEKVLRKLQEELENRTGGSLTHSPFMELAKKMQKGKKQ